MIQTRDHMIYYYSYIVVVVVVLVSTSESKMIMTMNEYCSRSFVLLVTWLSFCS